MAALSFSDTHSPSFDPLLEDDPITLLANMAKQHGPVFRLPGVHPTFVIAGREALAVIDDPALVLRAPSVASQNVPLFKTLSDPTVNVLGLTNGEEHQRRRGVWLMPGGLDHAGLAQAWPILNQLLDATLVQWEKQSLFSLHLASRRLAWRIGSRLMLDKEADEHALADVEISVGLNTQGDQAAAKQRILDWVEQEAAYFAAGNGRGGFCMAARLAGAGGLSRAELVNEIKHGFMSYLGLSTPMEELLREVARDRTRHAALRAELAALDPNLTPAAMRQTPLLMSMIKAALRITVPAPVFFGQAQTAFTLAGVHIPANAIIIGALHTTLQLPGQDAGQEGADAPDLVFGSGRHRCPGEDISHLALWLMACKLLAAYELTQLDPLDQPVRRGLGYFAPRGGFVQLVRTDRASAPQSAQAEPPEQSEQSAPPAPPAPPATPPFAPHLRPRDLPRATRIAIVGAGITGLTCAHELRKLGFAHVTVFEQAASVGGKADTLEIDGRPYNMGAHLCDAKLGVAALASDVGIHLERAPNYTLWDIEQNRPLPRSFEHNAAVKKLRRLYASNRERVHARGFAATEAWTHAPVSSWLDAHELGALREIGPFFTGAGYGFLNDDLPAAFFLKFAQDMNEEGWTPTGGYKNLLQAVSRGLDVRCSTEVVGIRRSHSADGTPAIHLTTRSHAAHANHAAAEPGGALEEHRFERLILTGPLEQAGRYLDLSEAEQSLFSRIKSCDYYTVLATLDIAQPHAPGLYIVTQHTATSQQKGHTTAFVRAFADSNIYHFFCYGESGQSEESILANLRADASKLGGTIGQVHAFQKWAYAPQVSPHDMALGFHRRMEAMQGCQGTYYAGSLLAFELTDHNVLFAKNLIAQHFAGAAAGLADEAAAESSTESPPESSTETAAASPNATQSADPAARLPESGTRSLLDILRERHAQTPDAILSTFLDAKGRVQRALSYDMLVRRACAVAAVLQSKGVQPGDRVALVYPPDTDEFLIGFFGCWCAQAVAVPAACPDPRKLDIEIPRFAHLMQDCDCRYALTTRAYHALALAGRAWSRVANLANLANLGSGNKITWPKLTWISTDGLSPLPPGAPMPIPAPAPETLAYLQYTSGSTSAPKGVMITHGNALYNVDAIRRQTGVDQNSVLSGWVPLFHDMGLVGGPLTALYCGAHMVFFSPVTFLQNPLLWLKAIHQYRATHTESPNFGYEFLIRHLDQKAIQGLDLSCLQQVLFGGEAMRHRTFERLAESLHGTGFRPRTMTNIFGAAEATLYLAGGGSAYPPLLSVSTLELESKRRAVPKKPDLLSTTTLIGCGLPGSDSDVRIVDPDSRRLLPERQVGEIWIASPSIASGYWGYPEPQNAAIFRARIADDPAPLCTYLRTGDLGFIERNVLYICGRLKEMMIFSGRNIHPMDIELCVMNAHPAIRQGCVVAFSVEQQDQEKLVIVAELKTRAADPATASAAAAAIAQQLAEQHSLACQAIALVQAGSLPKTSSGKLQRYRARERFLAGQLGAIYTHQAEQAATFSSNMLHHPEAHRLDEADDPRIQQLLEAEFSDDVFATRQWLQALVGKTLHVAPEQIDSATPLVMLGVDSAQAVMMTSQLARYLKRGLAPAVLYQHPSIDDLALFLCSHTGEKDRGLVQLQHGDPAQSPTLFCVHPVGGSAMAYLELVAALPNSMPVFAFGNETSSAPDDDLVAMARCYVAQMQAVQAEGPWYLLGYSFGGSVAYEMARQIMAAGGAIAGLFMIDTPAPVYREHQPAPQTAATEIESSFLETAILNHLIPDQLDDQERERLLTRIANNQRALVEYRVTLGESASPALMMLRASAEAPHLRDFLRHPAFDQPDFGWEQVAAGSVKAIVPVPGDHFSVMHAPSAVAAQLVAWLEQGRQ